MKQFISKVIVFLAWSVVCMMVGSVFGWKAYATLDPMLDAKEKVEASLGGFF